MARKGPRKLGTLDENTKSKPLEPGSGFDKFRAAVGPPFFIGSGTGRFSPYKTQCRICSSNWPTSDNLASRAIRRRRFCCRGKSATQYKCGGKRVPLFRIAGPHSAASLTNCRMAIPRRADSVAPALSFRGAFLVHQCARLMARWRTILKS